MAPSSPRRDAAMERVREREPGRSRPQVRGEEDERCHTRIGPWGKLQKIVLRAFPPSFISPSSRTCTWTHAHTFACLQAQLHLPPRAPRCWKLAPRCRKLPWCWWQGGTLVERQALAAARRPAPAARASHPRPRILRREQVRHGAARAAGRRRSHRPSVVHGQCAPGRLRCVAYRLRRQRIRERIWGRRPASQPS